jgi:hypothetical protein
VAVTRTPRFRNSRLSYPDAAADLEEVLAQELAASRSMRSMIHGNLYGFIHGRMAS